MLVLGLLLHKSQAGFTDIPQIQFLYIQFDEFGFHFGKIQYIIDELEQMFSTAVNVPDEMHLPFIQRSAELFFKDL